LDTETGRDKRFLRKLVLSFYQRENMPRRIPSLTSLSAFEAAARRLHFSRAAEELAVTPGAVSRQIQSLEASLGVQLFDREKHVVALTALGRAFAVEVSDILDRLELASDRIRSRNRLGPLSICAYPAFALRWLIPRWRKFHDLHPSIDLQLTTSLTAVDAARDGFDAIVRFCDGKVPGHTSIFLAPLEVFPVCRPSFRKKLRQPSDLRSQILIHCAARPNDWPRWLSEAGLKDKIDSTRGPRFESLNLAYQAAIEGVGVAMGVGCLVTDDLETGRLVRPISLTYRSKLAFYLVYPTTRSSDPQLTALCNFLSDEAQRGTRV
jgi:LysR family transcriptional regulator, glycine cleavage system transcriptional activator